ncbi:hypothetical protein [Streptomyces carpinensis]|uniref:Integrase n=1 Tax=Streptomyces carpinensis TaxID=66369 RepID=A0ABV1W3J8_9ACTN|nr:hypothetical protein [Streptomyces carpinensis]
MTFRLAYRFGCSLLGRLRPLARSTGAKDIEILVFRQQLAVLQRSSPKPVSTRGDRAVLAALVAAVRRLSRQSRTAGSRDQARLPAVASCRGGWW